MANRKIPFEGYAVDRASKFLFALNSSFDMKRRIAFFARFPFTARVFIGGSTFFMTDFSCNLLVQRQPAYYEKS